MVGCPSEEQIFEFLSRGRLGPEAQIHVDGCQRCRKLVAAVAQSLVDDADQASAMMVTAKLEEGASTWRNLHPQMVIAHEFVLEEFLGGGGMGVVWGARRLANGEQVALKFLRALDEEGIARQRREAWAASTLVHPHILRVHGVHAGSSGLGPVLVCERLYGETLLPLLQREKTLALVPFSRLFAPILAAILHAHHHGVLHRDIKPENIFLSRVEMTVVPKVVDFGIARMTLDKSSLAHLTKSGTLLGSPRYMSPEQIFGETPTFASDAWALGVVAFRSLVGRFPIQGENLGDIVRSLMQGRIDRVSSAGTNLPPDVQNWIDRTLSIKGNERPPLSEGLKIFSATSV